MPYSMTGFGAAEGSVAGGRLRVEIRTVNHRYFNLAAKLPADLAGFEGELRERLRRDFDRGHLAVQVRWVEVPAREVELTVDLGRARAVTARFRELQTALGLDGDITVEMVARQPGVLGSDGAAPAAVAWPEVEAIVAQAVAECVAMRQREGAALVAELGHRVDLLERGAAEIARLAPERLVRERDRLRTAVGELVEDRAVDEQRLAQEVAYLADRLDITEELVRLRSHVAAVREVLAADRPAGKQLGFLAQELGREVNTIGSKANDADIARRVVEMKGELEKFREQLENIE